MSSQNLANAYQNYEDEAYIMNRKKKEKSVLRKELNVYVLDLFVKVPSGAVAPIKYKPIEVDAINQGAQPNFLTAGGVSVEHRSKRPGA